MKHLMKHENPHPPQKKKKAHTISLGAKMNLFRNLIYNRSSFFQRVAMLHIQFNRMKSRPTCKQMEALTLTPCMVTGPERDFF